MIFGDEVGFNVLNSELKIKKLRLLLEISFCKTGCFFLVVLIILTTLFTCSYIIVLIFKSKLGMIN